MSSRLRDQSTVVREAGPHYARAVDEGLMQLNFTARDGKTVTLEDGRVVTEFVSCSYLGLDTRAEVLAGARAVLDRYGLHFCCARSRLTIDANRELEAGLSRLFGGHAITFPTVTSAHMSALPLVASGALLPDRMQRPVRLVFDRFAHASMQYLKPVLAEEARLDFVAHNDLAALEGIVKDALAHGETPVYVADGVYSMGGVCPLDGLLELAARYPLFLYLDDAHGTSIFGARGEGSVLSRFRGAPPDALVVAFSLAKGFGTNGGGLVLPTAEQAARVRTFGQTYAFSAPLDFAVVGGALEVVKLHESPELGVLQRRLREVVASFDAKVDTGATAFSPIRMVPVGDADDAITLGRFLLDRGFYVSVAFFPIVPRGQAQLRVCLTTGHTEAQLAGLAEALAEGRRSLEA